MTIDIHALSGAYAVDALDDAERAQFEVHLDMCTDCRAEVDSLREAAALLAETTLVAPSAELRNRVLAQVSAVRPLPPETGGAHRGAPSDAVVVPMAHRRRRRMTFLAAAAAAVIAIGAGGVVWQQVNDDAPGSRVEQILEAGDAQEFTTELPDGGTATVTRSVDLNEAVISADGMGPAPSGHQYVLWLQHGSTMTQAGTMAGGSDAAVVFSGDAASADGAAVSVEDDGVPPTTPSDDVVAAFDFDSPASA
jgi:anti-sigma-K factor RskA